MHSGRLTLDEIDRIVLPRKTLVHRPKIGRLMPDQSDRSVQGGQGPSPLPREPLDLMRTRRFGSGVQRA
jgi:hypothetical protein